MRSSSSASNFRLFRERGRRFDDADAMPHEIDEAADDGGFYRPLHGRGVPSDRTESDLVECIRDTDELARDRHGDEETIPRHVRGCK